MTEHPSSSPIEPTTVQAQTMIIDDDPIAVAFRRNEKALSLRPSLGQASAATRVRLGEDLSCEAEEGPWKLSVHASPKVGGDGLGPNPGVLGRAALGSCLAMSYARWAAALGVPFSALEVEVQADYDARGEYGLADIRADYQEVRYVVTVESAAPESEVRRVLDKAEAHTPFLDVFRRPQPVRRVLRINPGTR